MSLTFSLILTASAAAAPPPEGRRWERIVSAAHEMDVPTPRLFDALAASAPRREAGPRYCFEDRLTNPEAPTKVCRTRAEWLAFGLEPVVETNDAG